MSLFDKIFRPDSAKKSDDALRNATAWFQTLNAYTPVFTTWGGAVYESEIVEEDTTTAGSRVRETIIRRENDTFYVEGPRWGRACGRSTYL